MCDWLCMSAERCRTIRDHFSYRSVPLETRPESLAKERIRMTRPIDGDLGRLAELTAPS